MKLWKKFLRRLDRAIRRRLVMPLRHDRVPPHAAIHSPSFHAPQKKHPARSLGQRIVRAIAKIALVGLGLFLVFVGIMLIWIATLKTPEFTEFTDRIIAHSTKIYDRTGEVLLYDVHESIQRTVVPIEDVSPHIIDAVVAIEDRKFYEHKGIDTRGIIRAIVYTGLSKVGIRKARVQGGSTLTQQVLKNTLLTNDRTIKRKMKEWFLALKLEKVLTKEEILEHYLNEAPYGGSLYGIETASQAFFAKPASDVTIAEAAYLAAIPNAPTFYSPYGQNTDRLDARKNTVLRLMHDFGYLTQEEYEEARAEEVAFRPREERYAKAIHFVEYVRAYLEETYGSDVVETGGLEVITTLDYDFQKEAESIVAARALENEENWDASNMALVALDPQNGEILTMVGSRGYNDADIDGKFNVALAHRQPGSSFKPFIYAQAIQEGYTDQTALFDAQTQFTTHCEPDEPSDGDCYRPGNYDGRFLGPMTMRTALAQSRNVPAVKMLYLVGLRDAITLARNLGITSLRDAGFYGLTLVLGGGEVRLLDMVGAYGVFANDGLRVAHTAILEVRDSEGTTLEKHEPRAQRVLEPEAARTISSILSDNPARTPLFGANSFMYFGGTYDVAAKTGTTNSNRDAWLVGYTPRLAVGVWSGNNDNTPMRKGSSISGPAWRDFFNYALPRTQQKRFVPPAPLDPGLKPALRGVWQGNESLVIDSISGKLATEFTPPETRVEIVIPDTHTILHWVNPGNPRGAVPSDPTQESQYENWEYGVQAWLLENEASQMGIELELLTSLAERLASGRQIPIDDVHTADTQPRVEELDVSPRRVVADSPVTLEPAIESEYPITQVTYLLDGLYLGDTEHEPFSLSFVPSEHAAYTPRKEEYTLTVEAVDQVFNRVSRDYVIVIEASGQ